MYCLNNPLKYTIPTGYDDDDDDDFDDDDDGTDTPYDNVQTVDGGVNNPWTNPNPWNPVLTASTVTIPYAAPDNTDNTAATTDNSTVTTTAGDYTNTLTNTTSNLGPVTAVSNAPTTDQTQGNSGNVQGEVSSEINIPVFFGTVTYRTTVSQSTNGKGGATVTFNGKGLSDLAYSWNGGINEYSTPADGWGFQSSLNNNGQISSYGVSNEGFSWSNGIESGNTTVTNSTIFTPDGWGAINYIINNPIIIPEILLVPAL